MLDTGNGVESKHNKGIMFGKGRFHGGCLLITLRFLAVQLWADVFIFMDLLIGHIICTGDQLLFLRALLTGGSTIVSS